MTPEKAKDWIEKMHADNAMKDKLFEGRRAGIVADLSKAFPGMSEPALTHFARRKFDGQPDPTPEEVDRIEALVVEDARVKRLEQAAIAYAKPVAGAAEPEIKQQEKVVSIYHTGAAGHPTSRHLVFEEMRRRATKGEMLQSLNQESDALAAWLKARHPGAPPMQAKTIRNSLREEHRKLKDGPKLS